LDDENNQVKQYYTAKLTECLTNTVATCTSYIVQSTIPGE